MVLGREGIFVALFTQQRLNQIFASILDEVVPQDELAKRFSVSTRTIRSDINEINALIQNYSAHILYERGHGYRLKVDDEALFAKLTQQNQVENSIPRTSKERVDALLLKLLMLSLPVKLDDIAEEWFISRGTLQQDMSVVREHLQKYQILLESIPHQGIRLNGSEWAIRACMTETLWRRFSQQINQDLSIFQPECLDNLDLTYIDKVLHNSMNRFDVRLSNEGHLYLVFNCAVTILRITRGHELTSVVKDHDSEETLRKACEEVSKGLIYFLGSDLSSAELSYLHDQIIAQRIGHQDITQQKNHHHHELVEYILNYINELYNYDLRDDEKLKKDLNTHIAALMTRLQYHIITPNPLLSDIKQYYPFAYDVTLSALTSASKQLLPYPINEDELGYLAVHIGVSLERNYGAGSIRQTEVLVVTDAGNSTFRVVESKIMREFPQLKFSRGLTLQEYESLDEVEEDFVITTVRISEKNKPVIKIAPFPTPYQLEQIGKLAMIDQTRPYIIERFFDERYFMVINDKISQETLFQTVCHKLQQDGYVTADFYPSLQERESIVSTLLGEGIALPHSLGLLANKTVVVTIVAPKGIEWNKETKENAYVVFLLAISKADYEEAMAIYDLFVTFVKEKTTRRLITVKNFNEFQVIAKDSLARI
ncbi:TPA: transcription antiterminator [Providencia stuartii]|uniref:HTH domain protein n=3 Tax=Providencia stuartii TaxID=588 RepID=A0AA86YMS1_PROST|nr:MULTISPECIES: PRD domain-containing protein [Providencia]SST04248.1 Probable licABCH operon regulator [Acinetobacter baumannii]APG53227.1 transcription antiterminator BglG [Providencia stuartii]AVL42318.1 PRD domain-containing protein [Providencia stuartii]AXO20881.1 PRD domain-containing protein [Providencia stuartii]EDU60727.1 HTH domain protein [Providencia stuartii ATCC 25827]